MIEELLRNPIFVGGGAIGIFGGISYWAKNFATTIYSLIKREIVTSVEIREDDRSFRYIESFLANSNMAEKNKSVTVKTHWLDDSPVFKFLPSPGTHFFKHDDHWYWLYRSRDKLERANDDKNYSDTFYINSLFADKNRIEKFLYDCHEVSDSDKVINIYIWMNGCWSYCSSKNADEENFMILTDDQKDILEDVKKFNKSKDSYSRNGVPYKRGYLFHGVHGSGKSKLIVEMAKSIDYNIYFADLSDEELTDGKLLKMFSHATDKSIVVLEEIDTIFTQREKVGNSLKSNVISFGGLLSALDGVNSPDGRIVIMTTNHPEKLDKALIRPGRIDKRLDFGYATEEQVSLMVDRFFGKESDFRDIKKIFAEKQPTMAQLQEWCIICSENPEEVNNIEFN